MLYKTQDVIDQSARMKDDPKMRDSGRMRLRMLQGFFLFSDAEILANAR